MKNVTKAVAAAATAMCLLAAPSTALAGAGEWDYKGSWYLDAGATWTYFNSGGGDVQFCISNLSGSYGISVQNVDTGQRTHADSTWVSGYGNCAQLRSIGGAGTYMLYHRYSGQPYLTGTWYD